MSAETPILVSSFHVGKRTVTFTFRKPAKGQAHCSAVEWHPDMPKPTDLTPEEMTQYRKGRDAAFAELLEKAGLKGGVLIIE